MFIDFLQSKGNWGFLRIPIERSFKYITFQTEKLGLNTFVDRTKIAQKNPQISIYEEKTNRQMTKISTRGRRKFADWSAGLGPV